jgi:hypothetical protein
MTKKPAGKRSGGDAHQPAPREIDDQNKTTTPADERGLFGKADAHQPTLGRPLES